MMRCLGAGEGTASCQLSGQVPQGLGPRARVYVLGFSFLRAV